MIDSVSHDKCCGCRACAEICPKGAIGFETDSDGFMYPKLDLEKCVKCGKCLEVCPVNGENSASDKSEIQVFAARNKNEEILLGSSSGGVFNLLSKYVVDRGGVVFGAAFESGLRLCHIAVQDDEGIIPLMGSKYLQSDMTGVYRRLKDFLNDNRLVLFTGTPCQALALDKYLGKRYDNLIIADIICHGVPSQLLYDEYRRYIEKKYHSEVKSHLFRSKINGWMNFSSVIELENKKTLVEGLYDNLYMRSFLKNLSLRRSCYSCPANSYRSHSDITLGDFWSAERISTSFTNDRGVSAVMLNTEKGRTVFAEISRCLFTEQRELSELADCNSVLEKSVKMPQNRVAYLESVKKIGFEKADDLYVCSSFKERVGKRVKKILKH